MQIDLNAAQLKSEIAILRDTIGAAQHLLQSTNIVVRTTPQKRLALLVFHDLTKKADAVHELAAAGKSAGLEIIARSAFENFVDLLNLYRHPDHYPGYLLYLLAEGQRKGLQALVNNPDSPYSRSIRDQAPKTLGLTIEQMLEDVKLEKKQYERKLTAQFRVSNKKKKVTQRNVDTTVKLRAKLAGKSHEYESMYRMYSRPAHADIGSMLSSVIRGDEFVWPPIDTPPSSMAIDLATRMLIEGSILIAKKMTRPKTPFLMLEERYERWAQEIYKSNEN